MHSTRSTLAVIVIASLLAAPAALFIAIPYVLVLVPLGLAAAAWTRDPSLRRCVGVFALSSVISFGAFVALLVVIAVVACGHSDNDCM